VYVHSANTTVINNIFYHPIAGWAIQTANGFSGTIANNTFYGAHPTRDGHIMLWGTNSNVIIRNNIFAKPRNYAIVYCSATFSGSSRFDHNISYGVKGFNAGDQCLLRSSGLDTIAQAFNGIVDPLLMDPPSDFRLLPGSPAIGGGVCVSEAQTDFDGVPRSSESAYDVGAYNFSADLTAKRGYLPPGDARALGAPGKPADPRRKPLK
jgi:hypothetical protein